MATIFECKITDDEAVAVMRPRRSIELCIKEELARKGMQFNADGSLAGDVTVWYDDYHRTTTYRQVI